LWYFGIVGVLNAHTIVPAIKTKIETPSFFISPT
jgi:hypothetical protein